MAEKLGEAVLELTTDARRMISGMSSARAKTQAFGKQLSATGRQLSMRLTLPLVAAGGAAIKMAADFEKSMSEIVGLVGISQTQVNEWAEDIKILGPELGKSPKELADAMFFVTSAGMRGADALEVLTLAAKASAAGLGETKVVADAVTSAVNAYGIENLSAAEATDIMVATVREGKMEAADLAGSLGKVIPIASAMGVEFNEVGATLAALTRIGADAAMSTTALRGVMAGLLKPTSEAEEVLEDFGTSSAELRKKVKDEGLLAVLFDLKERFEGNDTAMAEVFGNIRALTGVLGLLGGSADKTAEIMASMEDNSGALDAALAAAEKTLRMKLNKTMASFKVALVEVGEVLGPIILPFLEKFAGYIRQAAERFANLSKSTQNFVLIVVGVAAALGPALMILGLLTKAVAALMAVVSSAALPWILLGAAIAAIAILIIKNWDTVKEAAVRLFDGLKNIWMGINIMINATAAKIYHAVKSWLVDKFKDMAGWLQVAWAKVSNVYIKARNFIVELFGGEPIPPVDISALEAQLEGLQAKRDEEVAAAQKQMQDAVTFGKKLVAEGATDIGVLAKEVGTGIADTFVGAWEKMSGIFNEIFGKGGDVATGLEETEDVSERVTENIDGHFDKLSRHAQTSIIAITDEADNHFDKLSRHGYNLTEERIAQINAEVETAMAAYTFEQEALAAMAAEERRIREENAAASAAALAARKTNIESFAKSVVGSFATTFGSMMTKVVEGTATIWEAFKEAGKAAIAAVLEALGQMAIVKAALAVAEAIMAFPNFAKMAAAAGAAIKFTLAAALAYGAAGAVRGLEFGGLITEPVVGVGTQSGTTYSIAERAPEYVGPPGEAGGSAVAGPMQGDVYLDGRKVGRWMQRLLDDQDILLSKGAYAR